jgi:hypothetical protein
VDSTVLPFLGLDNAFLGDNAFAGKVTTTPGSMQPLTAGDSIDVSAVTVRPISAASALTMVSTPTIPNGADGQHAYLLNAGLFSVTLQDKSKLAGTNLCLADGENLTLAGKAMAHLVYSSVAGCWTQAGLAGSGWRSPVNSVMGRTGAVAAQAGDYNSGQVTESGNLYFTDARARAAFSAGAGISLSDGVISATGGGEGGAVSSVMGRTGDIVAQAGDYNSGQVTEFGNLYFTDARARAAFTAGAGISLLDGVISATGGGAVSSVMGRTGDIVAQAGDYNSGQVTESGNLYFTDERARAAFSAGAGISLLDGVISATGGGGGGESTTATNAGVAGAGVLKPGTNVTARRLVAGANITVTENADDITISSQGGASGMQREFQAAVCQSAAGSLAWNVASSSAPAADCVIGSNGAIYGVAKFSNSATQAMQQSLDLPADAATITFDFAWRALAAGGDVVWQVQYLIVNADGTASDDPDLNGSGTVAAAPAVAAETAKLKRSTISIAPSSAGGKRIYFTVFRDNGHTGDTFSHASYMPELAKVTVKVQ